MADEAKAIAGVAVVTGGAQGIGKAFCVALANEPAVTHVVVVDRTHAAAHATAVALPHNKGVAVQADCGTEGGMEAVVRAACALGPIGVFVANAGVLVGGGAGVAAEDWDLSWRVNVLQSVWAAKLVIPGMRARGKGGHFVVVASAAGLMSQIAALPYAVTKHAAVSVAEWLSITHGDAVHVTCVCPQAVNTAMAKQIEWQSDEPHPAAADGTVEPEDVAACALQSMRAGLFLALPHPVVAKYYSFKGAKYEKWLRGMQAAHRKIYASLPPSEQAKL